MDAFVKVTYDLKGDGPLDGPLSLIAYERIQSLYAHIAAYHFPRVTAVIAKLANGDSSCEQQLTMYSKACVQPAYEYFNTKCDVDLASTMKSFKAARFFFPKKVDELELTAAELDFLSSVSFLEVNEMNKFEVETPHLPCSS